MSESTVLKIMYYWSIATRNLLTRSGGMNCICISGASLSVVIEIEECPESLLKHFAASNCLDSVIFWK